jgi:hypothetical protein
MQIKSPFKDYYDAGMGHSADKSLIYVRGNHAWDIKKEPIPEHLSPLVAFAKEHKPRGFQIPRPTRDWDEVRVNFGVVLLAGRIYPFARLSRCKTYHPAEIFYRFDYDSLKALLIEHGVDMDKRCARESMFNRGLKRPARNAALFFSLKGSDQLSDFTYKNQLVVASLAFGHLQVNPRLANFEFFRAMDPYQAFQEMSMFLGNLAAPDPLPVVLSEKERVAKHGFDKWSFRKMPEGR